MRKEERKMKMMSRTRQAVRNHRGFFEGGRCEGCVFHWLTLPVCLGELIKVRFNAECDLGRGERLARSRPGLSSGSELAASAM